MSDSYSDWFRVDLHIHTDWSRKTKSGDYNGNFSVPVLHQKMTENEVLVFSLTDHNIINIAAYEEYYKNYSGEEHPLLLVGVELDIVVDSVNSNTYHTLIIFNLSTAEGARRIHDALEAAYATKGVAMMERVLTMSEVVDLFPEDDFFFIPHAGSNKSIISPYRNDIPAAQQLIILMQSAMEKVKEQRRYQYNLGFDKVLTDAFKNRNDHAYIEFSDNHCIEAYPKNELNAEAPEHSFYYLKGSRSFETLRQAFIDPESRIRSSVDYKAIRTTSRFLEALEIEEHGILAANKITFSPHLNVIIGGRSSGKSLLLSMLGQKIDSLQHRAKSNYPINTDLVSVKAIQDTFPTSQTSIEAKRLTYINQGEIVNYFEDGDLSRLATSIGADSEYESAKKVFAGQRQSLETILNDLLSAYGRSTTISGEKFVLHGSTLDHALADHFTLIWDGQKVRDNHDLTEHLASARANIGTLLNVSTTFRNGKLFEFTDHERNVTKSFIELVERKAETLERISINNASTLQFLESVDSIISTRNTKLSLGSRLKDDARQSLRELKDRVAKRFQDLKDLKDSCAKVSSFDYSLAQEIVLSDHIKLVIEVEAIPDSTVEVLIKEGIKDADMSKSLYEVLLDVLVGQLLIKHHRDSTAESLRKKISAQLEPIYQHIEGPSDHLIYADGDSSKNRSPGYNSEKYLDIVLQSVETELVFIDQPEDNLGNAFIAERLVDLIRKIKFSKQVFLVTHNPSIVVHGDAENIIIATNEADTVSYSQVVIEDKASQKLICKILDGGEYIFDRRSKKYNIERILREHEHGN